MKEILSRVYLTSETLPPDGEYVLCHYARGNWKDSGDQEGCEWRVAKFLRGLSLEERAQLRDSDPRKRRICSGDEHGNNLRPYCWEPFGPGSFFGQDIDKWMRLPRD